MDQIAAGEMTKDEGRRRQPRNAPQNLDRDRRARKKTSPKSSGQGWTRTASSAPARSARKRAGRRRTARRTCCGSSGRENRANGSSAARLESRIEPDDPKSCDQTFPLPQRGDVFRLEERCSICDRTPRLKVAALPRPPLEPLPERRVRVDAGDEETPRRARSGESGQRSDGRRSRSRKATRTPSRRPRKRKAKAKAKASKADTATRGRQTRQSRRHQRLRYRRSVFISLEGVDGSGKSTQARLLVEALGEGTVAIREPGGTEAAERIRALLADPAVRARAAGRAAALPGGPRRPHRAGDPPGARGGPRRRLRPLLRLQRRLPGRRPRARRRRGDRPLRHRHRRPLARPDAAAAGRPRGRPRAGRGRRPLRGRGARPAARGRRRPTTRSR